MITTPPVCLTIGSSDSGGGAGIQGDIKAFASIGCFAATVLAGVTAQSTVGVSGRHTVPVEFLRAQLAAVRADFEPRAVKVGTAWSPEHVRTIADGLRGLDAPLVVDPVMVSAAGDALAGSEVRAALIDHLLPLAEVVTPNRVEAGLLVGDPTAEPPRLARGLVDLGAPAAVVTCGGEPCDWFCGGGAPVPVPRPEHATGAEHGAGCAHSAFLTGLRAHGLPLARAVERASVLAARAVRDGLASIGHGVHPVDALRITDRLDRWQPDGATECETHD